MKAIAFLLNKLLVLVVLAVILYGLATLPDDAPVDDGDVAFFSTVFTLLFFWVLFWRDSK